MTGSRTFAQQLAAGFAALVLLAAVMAVVASLALSASTDNYEQTLDNEMTGLLECERLGSAATARSGAVRGFLLTAEERFEDTIAARDREFEAIYGALSARLASSNLGAALEAVRGAWTGFRAMGDEVISERKGKSEVIAIADRFEAKVLPRWDDLMLAIGALETTLQERASAAREASKAASQEAGALVVGIGIATLLLALIIGFVLTRLISRQVGSSVQHVRGSSTELQAAASQQASGAKEQAMAMGEITTTISELLVTARQIALSSQRVSHIAGETASLARGGETHLRVAQDGVTGLRRHIDGMVQYTLDLGRRSQQIGGIVEIITELAEQTNILAINASIEAAGAGEAGRRFAVVGEEIRRLADRVSGSAKEIRKLIDEIRGAVNATVMATEAGSKAADGAAARFVDVVDGFRKIADGVATTTEAAKEIELSTKQQTTAVEQVNVAVASVAQATREAEAAAGQTLQTASQLAGMSNELMRLVRAQAKAGAT